ncbi:MAG TPA: hypothetical protein PLG47_05540, partial [Candidatus Dojkabacteria bacterium]|nr:hypothetical protein [Candidatus Dojkabacteria bacterium]
SEGLANIYVDGNNCIEAATNDLISDAKAWGASGRTLSTGSAVGTGLANTALIVLDLLDNSETDKAAQYCYELEAEVETDNVTKITLSSDFTTEYVGAGWQGGSEFRIGLGGGDFLSYLQNITSAARLWGGEITSNGNGTVHIAEGGGLRKLDEAGSEDIPITLNQGQGSKTEYVSWEEVAELELIDNAYNYIYYDYSDGVIATTTDFYSISFTQDFTIGRAYRYGTNVVVRLCGTNAWNFNRRVQLFGEEYFDVVRARGMIIGETGTRNISVTEGVLWAELVNRFPTDAFDSSGTDRFTYWYRSAVDTWTSVATQSQISNTQYNDLSTYTLKDLLPNRYGVHWIYMVHDSSVHVVYGNGNYTLAQAELATPPSSLPGLLSSYATLIGKCIIEKNATVFTELLTPFTDTFTPSVVTYHDDLSGLVRIDVPDTTSYVHLDEYSATALFYDTANPPTTIPTNDIRRDSNLGLGVDPSYKLDVNGTGHFVEALTLDVPLTVANGGTGQSTLTANRILVGNGKSGILSPSNLYWDNTNSKLGIATTTTTYGKINIGTDGAQNGIAFWAGSDTSFRIYRDSNVAYLTRGTTLGIAIDANGKVGIGTTS